MKDQGEKQVEALELLKPEENKEGTKCIEGLLFKKLIKNEIDEVKKQENKIKRKDLKFETNRNLFDF